MADRIMKILRSKYLVSYIGYEGMKRTEPLEIPEAALREIIYNALIHRLYTGTWIQMKVYNDRISVWNEGTLPEDFPVEMLLQEHSSRQRNPLIANVFFLAGFVETWGRGHQEDSTGPTGRWPSRPSLRGKLRRSPCHHTASP